MRALTRLETKAGLGTFDKGEAKAILEIAHRAHGRFVFEQVALYDLPRLQVSNRGAMTPRLPE